MLSYNIFPKQQILDSFKLKEFTNDNLIFDEIGRQFSKRVKNTVGKREITCNEQFFSFSHCVFKRLEMQKCKNHGLFGKVLKTLFSRVVKPGIVGQRVKNHSMLYLHTVKIKIRPNIAV